MNEAVRGGVSEPPIVSRRARHAVPPSGKLARFGAMLPMAVSLALTSGMVFRGYDSAQGAAACFVVNGLVLAAMLLLSPPASAFWTRVTPLLMVAAGAAFWLIVVQVGLPLIPFANRPVAFAPDLFAPQFAGWMAGLYAFLIGTLMAANRAKERQLMNVLLFANCAVLLFALVVRSVGGQEALDYWSLSRQGRFAGTIGNANVTAVVAGMMALLATGRLLRLAQDLSRRRRERSVVISALCHALAWLVAVTALIATASRAPIVVTAVLIGLLTLRSFGLGRVNWRRWMLYAAPAVVLIVLIGQAELLQHRLDSTSSEWDARMALWAQYWDIFTMSPLYGYGLGGFPGVNIFTMPSVGFAEGAWIVNSPHSIVLQLLLVGGLPYAALMVTLGWRVLRDIGRNHAASPWSTRRWSIAAAVLLALLCGTIDIVLDVTSTIVLMLFLAGLLWGRGVFISR